MSRMHLAIIALAALATARQDGHAQDETLSLPEIRQVWLDIQETPAVLGSGSWSIVPREEFEKVLRRAETVSQAQRKLPWLQSARYAAQVNGLELAGTAEVTFHNPHGIAAWAKFSPWMAPLRPGEFKPVDPLISRGDRGLNLLIGERRSEVKKFAWCVQGEERQDGRWFSLPLPACTQATLQVTVPQPLRVDWPGQRQHLSGPFSIDGSNTRHWEFQLGGQGRQDVQFVVREPLEQRLQAWTEVRLDADYVIGASEVQVRYEVELQRWHERLRTLTMDLPEGVQIKSAALRQLGGDVALALPLPGTGAISLTMPETLEHRATVVLQGVLARKAGMRLKFEVPGIRGIASIKPMIRVVTDPVQPLVNWQWGDYSPVQSPQRDRFQDSPVEVLTLSPRLILGTQPLKAPSAMPSQRASELSYVQDSWWHLGRRTSQLLVRSQIQPGSEQPEILSWIVPAGWAVKGVTCDTTGMMRAWTWHLGQPLDVQLAQFGKTLKFVTLMMRLEPLTPMHVGSAAMDVPVPVLQPVSTRRVSGCYAVTLDRPGVLQPVSLQVMKALGRSIVWPAEKTPLWPALVTVIPDLCWNIQDGAASGSVQVHEWPETVRIHLSTTVEEKDQYFRIVYRARFEPLAGAVNQIPLRFSSPVEGLEWKQVSGTEPARWKATSDREGEMNWPTELTRACELQTTSTWLPGRPVPLLTSPLPFAGTYRQGSSWLAIRGMGEAGLDDRAWTYDQAASSTVPVRKKTEQLALVEPVLTTRIEGSLALSDYATIVEAHAEPVTLHLPAAAQIMEIKINGVNKPLGQPVVLEATEGRAAIQIRYRTSLRNMWGGNWWKPVEPQWSHPTVPVLSHRIERDAAVMDVWGVTPAQHVSAGSNAVWLDRQAVFALAILLGLLSWRVAASMPLVWNLVIVGVALVMAMLLPSSGWPLAVTVCLGVFWARRSALAQAFPRMLATGLLLVVLGDYGGKVVGQQERAIELVYLIPPEKGQPGTARAMLSATLWKRLQAVGRASEAGSSQPWWVGNVQTEGTLLEDRLRFTSIWHVTTVGQEPVSIPWPMELAPESVRVDNQPVQPQLSGGAFGWKVFRIPIRQAGSHEMRVVWELPIRRHQAEQSAQIKMPGAPIQSLRIEGLPADVQWHGSQGTLKVKGQGKSGILEAEAGLAREVTLRWQNNQRQQTQALVDVGLLYEHRVHQSLVHAVLAYHIEAGVLDEMKMEIPAAWRVKQLYAVGELQASVTPRIKRWRVQTTERGQELNVQLQRPVEGTVHLLLEFLAPREWQTQTVSLAGIDTPGVRQRRRFIAYLGDGVQVTPLTGLEPANAADVDFARPWLPSLATLASSAICQGRSLRDPTIAMQLKPLGGALNVRTRAELLLEGQSLTYQYQVELNDAGRFVVCLQGILDSGLVVSEVTGEQVVRWHQTPAQGNEPGRLAIWFAGDIPTGKRQHCTIISRQVQQAGTGEGMRLPIYRVHWEGVKETAMSTLVRNGSSSGMTIEQETGLKLLSGPWQGSDVVAGYLATESGASITVKEQQHQQTPVVTVQREDRGGERQWKWTLEGAQEAYLPTPLELQVVAGQLEQNWQFECGGPMSARPSRGEEGTLNWTLQSNRPMKKLVIRCVTPRDAPVQSPMPEVTFPAWPGLVIPKAKE